MIFERNCLLGILAAALLAPLLFQNQYALHIGVLIMFSVMLATSFNLIVGYVGEFPLGHTAFLGVGAYTAALLSTRMAMPFEVATLAAPLVAALFGLESVRSRCACAGHSSSSLRCASPRCCG